MTPTPPNAGEPVALLPCPFCGGRAAKMQRPHNNEFGIECANDCTRVHGWFLTLADAEAAWNIRAKPNAGVVTDEMVKTAAMAYLRKNAEKYGYCPDTQFGMCREQYMIEFRAALEAVLSTAPKPECTVVHSEDPSAPAYLAHGAVKVTRERCG